MTARGGGRSKSWADLPPPHPGYASAREPETLSARDDETPPGVCGACARELPVGSAPWRRYCSPACRTRAWRRRHRGGRWLLLDDLLPEDRAGILALEAAVPPITVAAVLDPGSGAEPFTIDDLDPEARRIFEELQAEEEDD